MGRKTVKRKVKYEQVERKRRVTKITTLLSFAFIAALAIIYFAHATFSENSLKSQSLTELQAIARDQPSNPRVLYYLGRSYRSAGKSPEALDAFRRAAGLNPNDEATVTEFANAESSQDPAAARTVLEDFLKQHPNSAAGHLSLAGVLHGIDDPMGSFKEAQMAAHLDPRSEEAWTIVGNTEARRQNSAGAELAFAKLVALQPNQWRHRLDHGDALLLLGRIPEATSEFREAVRLGPNEAEPLVGLGKALGANSTPDAGYDDARRVFNEALTHAGNSPKVTFNTELELGKTYISQARWSEALHWFQLAAAIHSDNEEVHFQLAKCFRMLGDSPSADNEMKLHQAALTYQLEEIRLTSILRVDPKDDNALLSLARLYANHRYEERALNIYQILLRRSPQLLDVQQEYQRLMRHHA